MLSVSKIQDAGAARSYYEQIDDYYSKEAGASSAWVGKGAHELGLTGTGPVDPQAFEAALLGRLPDGTAIGNPGAGHVPGWDLTFSAPKSVSALALATGDERLIKAHDEAVKAAMAQIEERAAVTRIKESGGRIRQERTHNLVAATFRHETSREQDPQLHTHCVVLNATLTERGWRSIESREIYKLQKEGGEIYRAELAARVAQLGYQIEHTHVGEGKAASRGFEIHGVPQNLLDHWSSRSQQVEAALAARGRTRETATAEEREKAALDSRKAKEVVSDHAVLRDRWHAEAKARGIDLERLAAASRASEKEVRLEWYKDEGTAAREALAFATAKLEERNAVFTSQELIREARLHGMGNIQERAIHEAIYHAQVDGSLKAREAEIYNPATGRMEKVEGFTSRTAIENERAMLAAAGRLKAGQAVMSRDKAIAAVAQASARAEHAFNAGQRDAALHILSVPENLVLVQGYAGTAKTTSVLACASAELQKQGYTVKALAPTASAAQTLGDAIVAKANTMQSHLVSREQPAGKQVWILDEASLASARDMKTLLEKADREQAKVVLVGDVKQLGSVEAGAAFRQLQEHASQTQILDEIVRQRDAELKAAVYDAIRGDARAALDKVEVREIVHQRADGTVDKVQSHRDRLEAMAKDYASMARDERDKTLVIAPARVDRAAINDQVRQHLTQKGELGREEVKLQTYVVKDMTRAEARDARSYRAGDTIEFQRDYKSIGAEKGERWKVEHVDTRNNTLRVSRDGKETAFDPSKHTKTQALESREIGVRQGDKLTYTANGDRKVGEINGRQITVEKLDAANGRAVLKDEYGHRREVETKDLARVDHAYCQTAHQAQGKTCDRVMALAESNQVNLTNQKSLYVEVSRAKDKAVVYTDSKEVVGKGIEARSGEKQTALDRDRVISNGPPGPGAGGQKQVVGKGIEARQSVERGGHEAGRAPVGGGLER